MLKMKGTCYLLIFSFIQVFKQRANWNGILMRFITSCFEGDDRCITLKFTGNRTCKSITLRIDSYTFKFRKLDVKVLNCHISHKFHERLYIFEYLFYYANEKFYHMVISA